MTMEQWVERLSAFLQFNEFGLLEYSGRISEEVAGLMAFDEYEKFVEIRLDK